MKRLALVLFVLAGCGDPAALIATRVELSSALVNGAIGSVDLVVIERRTGSGRELSCAALPADWHSLAPAVHSQQLVRPPAAHVAGIEPGNDLLLIAEGYASTDGTGERLAHGCAELGKLTAGRTTSVTITLVP